MVWVGRASCYDTPMQHSNITRASQIYYFRSWTTLFCTSIARWIVLWRERKLGPVFHSLCHRLTLFSTSFSVRFYRQLNDPNISIFITSAAWNWIPCFFYSFCWKIINTASNERDDHLVNKRMKNNVNECIINSEILKIYSLMKLYWIVGYAAQPFITAFIL